MPNSLGVSSSLVDLLYENDEHEMFASRYTQDELFRFVESKAKDPQRALAAARHFLSRCTLIEPDDVPSLCRDSNDDPIVACAIASESDLLVSGDKDVFELNGHPASGLVRIVTLSEALRMVEQRAS